MLELVMVDTWDNVREMSALVLMCLNWSTDGTHQSKTHIFIFCLLTWDNREKTKKIVAYCVCMCVCMCVCVCVSVSVCVVRVAFTQTLSAYKTGQLIFIEQVHYHLFSPSFLQLHYVYLRNRNSPQATLQTIAVMLSLLNNMYMYIWRSWLNSNLKTFNYWTGQSHTMTVIDQNQ